MDQTHHDKYLEDRNAAEVEARMKAWAVDQVAARGTTFTALREELEARYGRKCDDHGLDHCEYRVRFLENVGHADIGTYVECHDFVLDLSRDESDWRAIQPFARNPRIQELLVCL